ncbi:uncharacterized protein M6B38_305060 [Iris pallida]|uniref:Uncharacterized protein n=1 Tax=Iris pallida TaxID=29817 RepID=A0AAX6HLI1_IRIPA|nr:uncharacterized protein M6B38_305060 [Iris pallida]
MSTTTINCVNTQICTVSTRVSRLDPGCRVHPVHQVRYNTIPYQYSFVFDTSPPQNREEDEENQDLNLLPTWLRRRPSLPVGRPERPRTPTKSPNRRSATRHHVIGRG